MRRETNLTISSIEKVNDAQFKVRAILDGEASSFTVKVKLEGGITSLDYADCDEQLSNSNILANFPRDFFSFYKGEDIEFPLHYRDVVYALR
ncbi:MAG: hypothetical protein HRT89_10540 [Lentisphaeria bacterium]|nr:hypothetical protein [Lentisphaeria bacterium]NQZ68494.1 hypothetical protein [Lentisphaeria bacterium]